MIFRYCIDCTKLKELGWEEEFSFEEGFKSTIEHYISKKEHYNECLKQAANLCK